MIRRLLERLEHGVERRARELVDLVDDVDLEAPCSRCISRILEQFAHAVDLRVGRSIEFDEVDKTPLFDAAARRADATRIGGHASLAVQRAGQDAGKRGLADTPGTGEQVGMVQPPA